jgi:hypothetical protein
MGQLHHWGPLRFNFDGLCCNGGNGASRQDQSYVQIFRNGAMEAVSACFSQKTLLDGPMFEQDLLRAAPQFIEFQSRLGFGPPLFVGISALSVKGYVVAPTLNPVPFAWHSISPIREDVLLAPEVLIEGEGVEIKRMLRSALDTIWQACGWPGSPGYNEGGEWVGFTRFPR